jgi:hypothetical protein
MPNGTPVEGQPDRVWLCGKVVPTAVYEDYQKSNINMLRNGGGSYQSGMNHCPD